MSTNIGADAPCLLSTALGTEDEAEALASALVEARLAACVQITQVRSIYQWEGELRREPEWVLMIKTRKGRLAEAQAFIRERHSYETPEILVLPITGGLPNYLRWIVDSTTPASGP